MSYSISQLFSHYKFELPKNAQSLETVINLKIIKVKVLAGVTQWIGCQPVNQRVVGSIPS